MLLAEEELLFPDAAGATMVVVSRYRDRWNLQGTNGPASGGNGRLGDMRGVEKVAGHDHERGSGLFDFGRQLADGLDPLFLQAEALRVIADGGERFAQLPVRRVKKSKPHCLPVFTNPSLGIWGQLGNH
jgi:hypothetical protein